MSATITYSYLPPQFPGFGPGHLQRSDGWTIPLDLDNRDYQQFLAWVAEGNTPPEGWTGPSNPT